MTDISNPVFTGKRDFIIKSVDNGIYQIDLKKGEEIIMYPKGTSPDFSISPISLQLGIGGMPNAVGSLIAESDLKDLGVHTEMYSRRFESSFCPCKVNLNTPRGEALRPHTHQSSPSIPWQQIRAHRLGVQCLTDPDCLCAVTALVPTITGMGDHISGRVKGKVYGQVHSGTRLTDSPYFLACV